MFSKIYKKLVKAVQDFQLIDKGDVIAVCISGGKDSAILAKCMQAYQSQRQDFSVINLVMDPGYRTQNLQLIKSNLQKIEIEAEIFDSNIFKIVDDVKNSPCFVCARMRRGALYSAAKMRGANKIALGHHFDDVIETIMLGVIYNGQVQSMPPKLKSKNFENMQLIRPLYYVDEDEIIKWKDQNNLNFLTCACLFSASENFKIDSKRMEMKNLIANLAIKNPKVRQNIFQSAAHIDLKNIVGFKK